MYKKYLSVASPESQLLLLACRADHTADDEVRGWLEQGVDWDRFLQAVRVHQLLPLVCRRLTECGAEEILPEQMAALRLEARRFHRENVTQFAFFSVLP